MLEYLADMATLAIGFVVFMLVMYLLNNITTLMDMVLP